MKSCTQFTLASLMVGNCEFYVWLEAYLHGSPFRTAQRQKLSEKYFHAWFCVQGRTGLGQNHSCVYSVRSVPSCTKRDVATQWYVTLLGRPVTTLALNYFNAFFSGYKCSRLTWSHSAFESTYRTVSLMVCVCRRKWWHWQIWRQRCRYSSDWVQHWATLADRRRRLRGSAVRSPVSRPATTTGLYSEVCLELRQPTPTARAPRLGSVLSVAFGDTCLRQTISRESKKTFCFRTCCTDLTPALFFVVW